MFPLRVVSIESKLLCRSNGRFDDRYLCYEKIPPMRKHLTILLLCLGWANVMTAQCDINEFFVEPFDCQNGFFNVHLNFNIINPDGDSFVVMGNGTEYGLFSYDSLPITLGPLAGDGVTEWEFVVVDQNNQDCQAVFILGTVQCCAFTEVVIDPTVCTNAEVFSAIVNFDHSGTGGLGFDVFNANGGSLGFFLYANLPVTVSGIPSVGNGFTHITICDNDNEDCCTVVEFEGLDCNQNDCDIFNVDVLTSDCENGLFYVTLSFNFENVSDSFTVNGNGNSYGTFLYSNLPITIGPLVGNGETVYEFVVHDVEFEVCSGFAVLEPVLCQESCGFIEVNVDPLECQGEGFYALELDFIPVEPAGAGFSVFAQGELLGSFLYSDLPVFVDSFPASCDFFDVLTISDNDDLACVEEIEFAALLCCDDCLIYDLIAEHTECDSNDQFYVVLNFQYLNVSDNGFSVGGNGDDYGDFNYDDLPITLGPFDGDGTTFYEFVVTDLSDGFCFDATELGIINCVCGFDSLVVDPLDCSGNGTYNLYLNFVPVGVTNQGFDVYAGNNFVGYFLYENLPLIIEDFPDGDGPVDVITICDNDNPSCCASLAFDESVNCSCDIFDLVAEAFDCNEETNTFALYIDFGWEGNTEAFNVYKGDLFIATVEGANLPDTLYGLTDDGGGALISVCAVNFPDCCAAIEIDVPQCGEESCDIFELVAEAFDCNEETNTFALYINFQWTGNIETFDVYKGDLLIATVEGANLPDTLFGLTDDGGGALISVCANDNFDCCQAIEIDVPQCGEEQCDIFDLIAEAFECDNETNTFALYIDFQWTGNIETFDVYKGDLFIGTVEGANLPDTLYGLTDDGGGALISVCANDNFDCCQAIEIDVPQCGEEPCDIFDLVAEAFECDTSSNTFALYLDFQWTGNDEVFNVFKGNVQIGEVLGVNLPDTLYGLTDNGGGALITVCADNHPDCCASMEIAVPDCGAECEIFEVVADPGGCTSDSTFEVAITYQYQGFTNEFVELWTGDTYLGLFHINIQPIVIENFPWNGQEVMSLRICQNDHPDCCRTIEFEVPGCLGGACGFFEAIGVPLGCTTDSTFAALISFDTFGFDGPVEIWAGDTYLGLFPQTTPLLLLNIPEHDGGVILTICQAENEDCCTQLELDGLVCENVCSINNLSAVVSDCEEGTFTVTLNFDFVNAGDSFAVVGNGTEYGVFAYSQLPLTLGPLEGDSSTQWEFAVIGFENEFCVGFIDVGVVDCTTGISNPAKSQPLEIYYTDDGAYFNIPVGATEFSMWTYDGRMIAVENELTTGEQIDVSKFIPLQGLYFVQVRSVERTYVGKVVGF